MFEDIPEDREESYQCEFCVDGKVIEIDGKWECDSCSAVYHESRYLVFGDVDLMKND